MAAHLGPQERYAACVLHSSPTHNLWEKARNPSPRFLGCGMAAGGVQWTKPERSRRAKFCVARRSLLQWQRELPVCHCRRWEGQVLPAPRCFQEEMNPATCSSCHRALLVRRRRSSLRGLLISGVRPCLYLLLFSAPRLGSLTPRASTQGTAS